MKIYKLIGVIAIAAVLGAGCSKEDLKPVDKTTKNSTKNVVMGDPLKEVVVLGDCPCSTGCPCQNPPPK